jgi:transcriptional regulator with PAS, ATPase and Fis domain
LKRKAMQKEISGIDPDAMELLRAYSWPGNVRELENVMERAVALENGPSISSATLPDYLRNMSIETYRFNSSDVPTLEQQEMRYIRWMLEKYDGNKTRAAAGMGIDRVSLWRKLKKYGLPS